MSVNYLNKYLKYKRKFIDLRRHIVGGSSINSNDAELPTCPICLEEFSNIRKPILLHGEVNATTVNRDSSNHFICLNCIPSRSLIQTCPSCRVPLTNKDNYEMFNFDEETHCIAIPVVSTTLFLLIGKSNFSPFELLSVLRIGKITNYEILIIPSNELDNNTLTFNPIQIIDRPSQIYQNYMYDMRWSSITSLIIRDIQVTSLLQLPVGLIELVCNRTDLIGLPVLPIGLTKINCLSNQLSELPQLPDTLIELLCSSNELLILPPLPNQLSTLRCSENSLTSLPSLPNTLTVLSCFANELTELPPLPNTLTTLYCFQNTLTSLPPLHDTSLVELNCIDGRLTSIPPLPNTLEYLHCSENILTSLPLLPNTLIELYCSNNRLSSLPPLESLVVLDCSNNELTELPPLPITLSTLYCDYNRLRTLPERSSTLTFLNCKNQNTSRE